jgi:hypothetical protein
MATMLKRWLVALTEGEVNPKKLIWKGRSRNAPETPAIEVKKDMLNATRGGIHGSTVMPAIVKNIMTSCY